MMVPQAHIAIIAEFTARANSEMVIAIQTAWAGISEKLKGFWKTIEPVLTLQECPLCGICIFRSPLRFFKGLFC
ncbi:pyruvate ferredoxin flavodoxin delta subunit, putative [Babesia ovata]|uniref:Pyruvate ferredoxin flavodoxin delta subunit, putative n=1 Tax=Babesia ovata TaxID=189622 RepID=A0A2H6KDV8_9APIC|nr:pyruvate ferredoxin flavodoxin delta subunit, putative [Babesia ovata]GBE61182.1 pyruvate ferredoxin flavodoxin delta subunit, putative [Babesia ovata]